MKFTRAVIIVAIALAVLAAATGVILALTRSSEATKMNATLLVAMMALVVTVLKIILDLFVAPEDQLMRERKKRRGERVEAVATEIGSYFGWLGNQLREQLEEAWSERDWEGVQDRAGYLAGMAEKCFAIAEKAPDELEILIGVVWVEALEVRDGAESLKEVSGDKWDRHDVGHHLETVREWYTNVEDRLLKILRPE